MHRNHYPRFQFKVIAPRVPRLVLLWVLVTLALAAAASLDRARVQPVDGSSHLTLQNAPPIVQSLIEKYAPK